MKVFLIILAILFIGACISFYIEYKKAPTEED
jgi:hypothetical protein